MKRLFPILLVLWCVAMAAHGAPPAAGVGIIRLTAQGEYAVPIAVWYPSSVPSSEWSAGPYLIHATRDAPVAPGTLPLIMLSHGSGGGEFGHADLAEALARRGYVVAAPRHLGDSYDKPEGRGSDVQGIGRPWQIVAALDAVLADKRLNIDRKRIGMAGFSAGGYTTLVMAGARPDFSLHAAHCKAHPDDAEMCPAGALTQRRVTRPGWKLPEDRRIRAAVAMAPLSALFDAQGVADVRIPLRIYQASDDQLLRAEWHADHLLGILPRATERGAVPGGHYVFLAPCSDQLKLSSAPICTDAPGVDRQAIHARLNAEIADFFDRKLAGEGKTESN